MRFLPLAQFIERGLAWESGGGFQGREPKVLLGNFDSQTNCEVIKTAKDAKKWKVRKIENRAVSVPNSSAP